MAEYIEREALLEAFDNADADVIEDYGDGTCDWGFGLETILEVINCVPSSDVAPAQKWISVKDRLPRDGEDVIVVASGKCGNITLVDAIEFAEFSMSKGWILEMWPE